MCGWAHVCVFSLAKSIAVRHICEACSQKGGGAGTDSYIWPSFAAIFPGHPSCVLCEAATPHLLQGGHRLLWPSLAAVSLVAFDSCGHLLWPSTPVAIFCGHRSVAISFVAIDVCGHLSCGHRRLWPSLLWPSFLWPSTLVAISPVALDLWPYLSH